MTLSGVDALAVDHADHHFVNMGGTTEQVVGTQSMQKCGLNTSAEAGPRTSISSALTFR